MVKRLPFETEYPDVKFVIQNIGPMTSAGYAIGEVFGKQLVIATAVSMSEDQVRKMLIKKVRKLTPAQ